MKERHLLIFNLTGLNPSLDLIPIPLKLLDFLFQVRFKLFLLIRIVRVVNLPQSKITIKIITSSEILPFRRTTQTKIRKPCSRYCRRHQRLPGPS